MRIALFKRRAVCESWTVSHPIRQRNLPGAHFFLNSIARVIFSPLMPTMEQDLSLNHVEAGSLFLANAGSFGLGIVLVGIFVIAGGILSYFLKLSGSFGVAVMRE